MAFILAARPGGFTGSDLYKIENLMNGWLTRFSILTDGSGVVQVASTPREDVPVNPGVKLPPVTPRTLPPNIEDGVSWLMNNQRPDGSWMDLPQTAGRDTAEAVQLLRNFDAADQSYANGLLWLAGVDADNIDYLAREIDVLANAGENSAALLNKLVSKQNPDGGWGSDGVYMSNPIDTSFALKGLSATGLADAAVVAKAVEYLKSKQNSDGSWSSDFGHGDVEATASVLSAFNAYRKNYALENEIVKAVAWLIQRQNTDGGFGNSPSTVYHTAAALLSLREFDVSTNILNKGLAYILK